MEAKQNHGSGDLLSFLEGLGYLGLSQVEADKRLADDGPNELPANKPKSPWAIGLRVVSEPMFLLLLACVVVYGFLGDRAESVMLAGAVGMVILITFVQERKSENALAALRDLSSPRARVIRGGEIRRIPGREVVVGDLVLISEGDRVPSDGVVVSATSLEVDESSLTGESIPSAKVSDVSGSDVSERHARVFYGTLVVKGQGAIHVVATGVNTEIGAIGKSLRDIVQEPTLLQRTTARLVRNFAVVGLTLCAVVAIVYSLTRGDWLSGLLAGMTMAISAIPEEFPVVLTIFLALGAWRIAKKNVLTRRVAAIETLGAATVLCVDKTGTLTENRMTVAGLWSDEFGASFNGSGVKLTIPESHNRIASLAMLASTENPFDPMEQAIVAFGAQISLPSLMPEQMVRQYAVTPEFQALSQVWSLKGGGDHLLAMKGAPEKVASLCHMDEVALASMRTAVDTFADRGYRVLAVGEQRVHPNALPNAQTDFSPKFVGLIALADPPRANVAASLNECYSAGVRVVMVTGDYPGTARSIARQIGLRSPDGVITGPELEAMDSAELMRRIRDVNVFARITPLQKLLLVESFKKAGEVVAMTGAGVNDAPALKSSHIGIAMGMRGTDVAREAADLVLLDDDFNSIVGAIRSGRRIYTNIKDAMLYILAIHIPIAGLSLFPVLFGWPLILLPMHILLLELVVDPACSIVFEAMPDEPGVMQQPPRDPKEPIFRGRTLWLSLMQGASVLVVCLVEFQVAMSLGRGAEEARALTYTTMLLANLSLIITNLSWTRSALQILRSPNRPLWIVIASVLSSIILVLFVPTVRELFKFSQLHSDDLLICIALSFLSLSWFEAVKLLRNRRLHRLIVP